MVIQGAWLPAARALSHCRRGSRRGAPAIVKQGDFCVSDSHDAYLAKSIARWLRELSQKRAQWLFVDTQRHMWCPALQPVLQVLVMLGGV